MSLGIERVQGHFPKQGQDSDRQIQSMAKTHDENNMREFLSHLESPELLSASRRQVESCLPNARA
jgi:hypothetical protein